MSHRLSRNDGVASERSSTPMTPWTNQLYFGDNLSVLREHIPDESVDLIYLDPPFNSNVLFKERSGEDAAVGIFITLEQPTEPMLQEAIAAGFYEPEALPGNQFPKVQILTIEQLLDGAQPDYPRFAAPQTFRKAPRRKRQQGVQQTLDA